MSGALLAFVYMFEQTAGMYGLVGNITDVTTAWWRGFAAPAPAPAPDAPVSIERGPRDGRV
jgi:hypothetical protein